VIILCVDRGEIDQALGGEEVQPLLGYLNTVADSVGI
jgi:hypothetical protein